MKYLDSDEDLVSETESATGNSRLRGARVRAQGTYDESLDPLAVHSRGLLKPGTHGSKFAHLRLTFGADERDLLPMIFIRDRWTKAYDVTFPSKSSLELSLKSSIDDFGAMMGVSGDDLRTEASSGWDWLFKPSSGAQPLDEQRMPGITESESNRYLFHNKSRKHTVLIGPATSQKSYQIGQGETLDFGDAWCGAGNQDENGERLEETSVKFESGQRKREGWILNLGDRIQSISWLPNNDSTFQYLAASIPVEESQKRAFEDAKAWGASAFTPSPPYPSAIQIWSFRAIKNTEGLGKLDMNIKPSRRLVICTDAGEIRRLAWCPMKREKKDGGHNKTTGLLAGIWGEGSVKILNVELDENSGVTEWGRCFQPSENISS